MKCPRCRAENYEGAKFCTACGAVMPPEPSKPVKFLSAILHALLYVAIMFACQSFVSTAYIMSLVFNNLSQLMDDELFAQTLVDQTMSQIVMISLLSNLLTILVICLIMRLRHKNPLDEFGVRRVNMLRIPTFAAFGVALNIFVAVTISFIPLPESLIEAYENQYSPLYGSTNVIVEIFSIAVVTGIVEEIIFRGIVNSRLSRGMGTAAVIIISSLIFGAAHATPIAIVYASLLGAVFSLMYEKFHSVIPGIICHACFNATSYILVEISDSAVIILYAVSIVMIAFCVYRMFIRRPTFYDYVLDTVGEHKLRDDTERDILAEVRRLQKSGTITPELLERLAEQWEQNSRKSRK